MKSLSFINGDFRIDSRNLASELDHRHRTILESIDKYLDELQELNPIPFETEKGRSLDHGGFSKSTRYAYLTEDQCYFILTLMRNNQKVVRAKLNLVKAFRDARAQLANRDIARIEGKKARIIETNSIQRLIDYASGAGSATPENYYQAITRMTNKIMGIEAGHRDNLSAIELNKLKAIELAIDVAIRDGLKAKLPYKSIYKIAKLRAESVAMDTNLIK